jgi:hypothetical protein
VFDDFDYGAVNKTASQAETCMVFANADSGERWVFAGRGVIGIQVTELLILFSYITVDNNAGDRSVGVELSLSKVLCFRSEFISESDPLARWRQPYPSHRITMRQYHCGAPHRRPCYSGAMVQPSQRDCHLVRRTSRARERKLVNRCVDWYR